MTYPFTKEMLTRINEAVNDEFHTEIGTRYEGDVFAASCQPTPMKIAKHIATTHPFVNGNKRTAIVVIRFKDSIETTIKENHDILELLSVT